jgi:hypothetical protein
MEFKYKPEVGEQARITYLKSVSPITMLPLKRA